MSPRNFYQGPPIRFKQTDKNYLKHTLEIGYTSLCGFFLWQHFTLLLCWCSRWLAYQFSNSLFRSSFGISTLVTLQESSCAETFNLIMIVIKLEHYNDLLLRLSVVFVLLFLFQLLWRPIFVSQTFCVHFQYATLLMIRKGKENLN